MLYRHQALCTQETGLGDVRFLLALVNRQTGQQRRISIKDKNAHVGLGGQKQYLRQIVRHAFVTVYLSQVFNSRAVHIQQIGIRPRRGNQFDTDGRAVGDAKGDKQKPLRRGNVGQFHQVVVGGFAQVGAADFPAAAVDSRIESQPLGDRLRSLFGIGIADVNGATIHVIAIDDVDQSLLPKKFYLLWLWIPTRRNIKLDQFFF